MALGSSDSARTCRYQSERQCKFIRTVCTVLPVDIEDTNRALIAHALLGDAHDLRVVLAERNPLDGCWELPSEEALARAHLPETHCVVGGTGDEEFGGCCENRASTDMQEENEIAHVQSTSTVQMVPLCPSYVPRTLAVVGEPDVDGVVF